MLRIDRARFFALTAAMALGCASPKPRPAPIVASAPAEIEVPDAGANDEAPADAVPGPSAEAPHEIGPSAEDAIASDYMDGPADEYGGVVGGAVAGPLPGPAAADGGAAAGYPDEIRRVMRATSAKVRLCYQAELKTDPTFETRVIVRFVIGQNGVVSSASLSALSGKPSMDRCVLSAFRRVRFPAPAGGSVTVSYPFVFKSS